MAQGRFQYKDGTIQTDTGTTGVLDTAGDTCVVDVKELESISAFVNRLTAANGTSTFLIEKSVDGLNWITVSSTKAQTDIPAGANKGIEFTLSDTNGMGLRCKQLRFTLVTNSGTATYSFGACGSLILAGN